MIEHSYNYHSFILYIVVLGTFLVHVSILPPHSLALEPLVICAAVFNSPSCTNNASATHGSSVFLCLLFCLGTDDELEQCSGWTSLIFPAGAITTQR